MKNPFYYQYGNSFPKYRSYPYNEINHYKKKYTPYDYFDLGDPAPDFTLEGIINKELKKVSLHDYRGKWVVVFFYGSDFTFV
ncbi:redoxin domain-containing protein [Crassaminicella thermophila]|uniref:Redoxin domain-containing protein n=1 Tax=Crassaminicella thermophila TaxID=2599308 RepID=A0A5C0SBC1_CRATE|nr:redoxin domain-containing protein [Crassaminicella thermophila]